MLISQANLKKCRAKLCKTQGRRHSKGELNRDAALLKRVGAIANRIKPHTAVFRKDAPGWNWK